VGHQPAQARIRITAFEAPAQMVREFALGAKVRNLPNSAYSVAVITPRQLRRMLGRENRAARLLYEDDRVIRDWPRATDSWSYSYPFDDVELGGACSGGAAGFLGVRRRGGRLEMRISYIINHRGANGRKAVDSHIDFECEFPVGKVLLFFAPSHLSNLSPRIHAVAFQAVQEERTSPYDKMKYGLSWLDRPAFANGPRSVVGMMQ
jgi:hypothetical protein